MKPVGLMLLTALAGFGKHASQENPLSPISTPFGAVAHRCADDKFMVCSP